MTTPHMMAEWHEDGIYFWMIPKADRAWQEFLDVLTGRAGSVECPTLEELAMTDEGLLQAIQDIINQGHKPADALELIRELLEDRQ